jgi:hypothetical protein
MTLIMRAFVVAHSVRRQQPDAGVNAMRLARRVKFDHPLTIDFAMSTHRFCILFAVCFLSVSLVFAQQTTVERGDSLRSFDRLRSSIDAPPNLRVEAPAVDRMTQQRDRTEMVKAWISSNAWRELPLRDQMWLFDNLRGADLVDKYEFSVRWTGTLRVPASGSYTFVQYRMPGSEGAMRLWVNGAVVLDSFPKEDHVVEFAQDGEEIEDDSRFQSAPIPLSAGNNIEFRLDYVQAPRQELPGTIRLPGFPIAVLQWESDTLERQVIPETAFLPPNNSAFRGRTGLQGEYFSDSTFTGRVALRRDASIDFMWDVGMVAAEHREAQDEIVAANVARLSTSGFFASLDESEAREFVTQQLPALLRSMTATQRVAVMISLTEQPDLLKHISFARMSAALRWLSLSASPDAAISLLVSWSELTPPPRTVPAFFPGRRGGGYMSVNIEPYFRLSRLFTQGNVKENIDALAEHMTKSDGSCNLTIFYILCCAARMTGQGGLVMNLIDEPVHDESLPGDVRVTWFLAEAFAAESLFGHDFQPGRGIPHIHEALEVAESPELQFWAFQELVARLMTSERLDEAKSVVEKMRDQFSDGEKQTQIDTWLQLGGEVAAHYQRVREAQPEPDRQAFIDELARRAAMAEQRGDTRSAGRYQQIVSDHNTEKERREAERARIREQTQ